MADISIIHNGNTDYNVKDSAGRLALAEVENKGAKNLLKNKLTTATRKGITFTINDDGSVTANGTNDNTGASVLNINTQTSLALSNGDYILTGCPAGGSDSGYMMDITRSPGSSIKDTGSGATFTVGGDYTVTEFRIVISRNVTVNNLKFYPMICTKEEWDISHTYVPYGKTNAELTAESTFQQSEIDYAINTGVKNLFPITASGTQTIGGVVFTVNSDGTITANGTKTNNDWLILSENNSFGAGTYTLSDGLPVDTTDCQLIITTWRSMTAAIMATAANARPQTKTFTTEQTGLYYAIRIASGKTVNNLTFKPMIRPAAITDPTYEPYALPNPTLTPAVIKAVNEGAKNLVQLGFTSTSGSSSVPATTNNNDGTITVNGSRVGNATILVQDLITARTSSLNTRYTLPAGNYVIAPTGNVNIGLQVYKHDGTTQVGLGNARIEALSFTYSETDKVQYPYICIRLYCEGNATINNFTFMPMICTASDWAVSQKFVPYAPTNRELYEEKIDHDLPVVSGSILDYADTLAPGIYFARQDSSTGSGKPVNNRRYVYNIYVYSQATTTIIAIDGENGEDPMIYTVNKVSGSWGPWIISRDYTYGIMIPDNSDLNNYTTPGKYYAPNSAANTASHLPVARGSFNFTLTVEKVTPANIVQHIQICRLADDPNIYRRCLYNNNWGSWYKFEGTEVT